MLLENKVCLGIAPESEIVVSIGPSYCPFMGLGSFGQLASAGSIGGSGGERVERRCGRDCGSPAPAHVDFIQLSKIRGAVGGRSERSRERRYRLVRYPNTSIQDPKKRFGGLSSVFREIQAVTGYFRVIVESDSGGMNCEKVMAITEVTPSDTNHIGQCLSMELFQLDQRSE
jgi:hypothetical protein